MISETKPARVLYENLDTSFVNVWALLRYLSQRSFIGRVHVELENYSADVFVNGSETPLVHEIDRGQHGRGGRGGPASAGSAGARIIRVDQRLRKRFRIHSASD